METGIAVTSWQSMEALALAFGFLPLFQNDIPGFSVEEHTPPSFWFSEGCDGPWEWKGPVVRNGRCAYGKFFSGKAGFVSLDWLPDFVNLRRDGLDFETCYAAGLIPRQDKLLYDALLLRGTSLTRELKAACGYRKGGLKGFDAAIARLQMQTYVTVADFSYSIDRLGRPYGWGMARYAAPETLYGESAVVCPHASETSELRMLEHLSRLLPDAKRTRLARLIRG